MGRVVFADAHRGARAPTSLRGYRGLLLDELVYLQAKPLPIAPVHGVRVLQLGNSALEGRKPFGATEVTAAVEEGPLEVRGKGRLWNGGHGLADATHQGGVEGATVCEEQALKVAERGLVVGHARAESQGLIDEGCKGEAVTTAVPYIVKTEEDMVERVVPGVGAELVGKEVYKGADNRFRVAELRQLDQISDVVVAVVILLVHAKNVI